MNQHPILTLLKTGDNVIIGVGTDIIEINRIKNAVLKQSFINKCFTEKEKQNKPNTLAGFFAAKEAFSKALGTGFRGFSLVDIEILKDELGKPYIVLYRNAKKICENLNVSKIHLSISHSKGDAVAFVVLES